MTNPNSLTPLRIRKLRRLLVPVVGRRNLRNVYVAQCDKFSQGKLYLIVHKHIDFTARYNVYVPSKAKV